MDVAGIMRLVLVVDGSSSMVGALDVLRADYLDPMLRELDQQDTTKLLVGAVAYRDYYGPLPVLEVLPYGPATLAQAWLQRLELGGSSLGGALAEGLAAALQLPGAGEEEAHNSHIALVCNTEPREMATLLPWGAAQTCRGQAAEMGQLGFTLSVVCPRRLQELIDLAELAMGAREGLRDMAALPQHLALVAGLPLAALRFSHVDTEGPGGRHEDREQLLPPTPGPASAEPSPGPARREIADSVTGSPQTPGKRLQGTPGQRRLQVMLEYRSNDTKMELPLVVATDMVDAAEFDPVPVVSLLNPQAHPELADPDRLAATNRVVTAVGSSKSSWWQSVHANNRVGVAKLRTRVLLLYAQPGGQGQLTCIVMPDLSLYEGLLHRIRQQQPGMAARRAQQ